MSVLAKKILAQRESRFEVLPGKFLKLRRPAEVEMVSLRGGITVERLAEIVIGWEGFTEADFLGAAIGSSDDAVFDAEAFSAWISDRGEEYTKTCNEVMRVIREHLDAKAQAVKN